jgi:hypothetical protein
MSTALKTPELSRHAAAAFAERWKNTTEELQHAQSFWADFFRTLCGIEDEKLAGIEYQKKVKGDVSGNQEYIDVYWKNVALIEHKSTGKNLDKAEMQARGYLRSLPPGYRPKTIIVSDFAVIRIIDVALNRTHEFPLSSLPDNIHRFEAIISGNRTRISQEEITVDQEAARLMANLYLELEDHGFEGHETSIFLVRILFLLFGDDTGMWAKNKFLKLVIGTQEDGSDVGSKLDSLFEVLNTSEDKRPKELDDELNSFPYVNGGIFAEKISVIEFNMKMRVALVDVANYDWTTINPTIFGSLFQLIKDKEARRELGEHYTSEENINKIVYPLFLDELQERLASAWDNKKELKKLRQDLTKIKIFDPACGCGNFLVVSYRHLRQLELELIVRLSDLEGTQDLMQLDGSMGLSITLNQFYGIEIEEWPAQVARMALFLTDHQENLKLARITGETQNRFPISESPTIIQGNSLAMDWQSVLKLDLNTFILGNPPFIGMSWMSPTQQADNRRVFSEVGNFGLKTGRLDYVACWYAKAIGSLKGSSGRAAFVSTNSIVQGEQARTLVPFLLKHGFQIDFAHRTFKWESEVANAAAVHVVIIGFSESGSKRDKRIFDYPSITGDPVEIKATNINFYLTDGPDIAPEKRTKTFLPDMPIMTQGSKPWDGGFLIIEQEDYEEAMSDPIANNYVRPYRMGQEMLSGKNRWCLWLKHASPSDLSQSSFIRRRLEGVRQTRLATPTESVQEQARTPYLFSQDRQPNASYLAIVRVSSENREYLPAVFYPAEVIAGDKLLICPGASLWLFGYLQSAAFTTWAHTFAGRMKSDISLSPSLNYYTFPFVHSGADQVASITEAAQAVLDARLIYEGTPLSRLYDPLAMPIELRKAHTALDIRIDALYNLKRATEGERLKALLLKYQEYASREGTH